MDLTSVTCWSSACFLVAKMAMPSPTQATARMMMTTFIFITSGFWLSAGLLASPLLAGSGRRRGGSGGGLALLDFLVHRLQIGVQNFHLVVRAQLFDVGRRELGNFQPCQPVLDFRRRGGEINFLRRRFVNQLDDVETELRGEIVLAS